MLVCGNNHCLWKQSKQIVEVSKRATYRGFWPVEGSEQEGWWVKCHDMKCHSVRAIEKQKIRDVINGIRENLSPSTVWFNDEPSRSWWACDTLNESHWNKRDLEGVQVWDYTIEDDLKKLISITYTNKMHLLFSSSSLRNSIVKCVWLRIVMGWVTFWKVSQQECEWGQSTLKSLMLVCGVSHWSKKQSELIVKFS